MVWGVIEFFISISMLLKSRCDEYAADEFSVEADPSYAEHLAEGLKTLTKNSKSNLTPHPFFLNFVPPTPSRAPKGH